MAQVEPMDVDNLESDFDDKENSVYNNNVFPKSSCTEKGYEELDMSEFNMKLRYSITPASSPMSRSYTSNYSPKGDTVSNINNNTFVNDNSSLTRSLNSSLTKTDSVLKSPKLPLQVLSIDQFTINEQNSARSFNPQTNVTVTITKSDNEDDILSLTSTPSSSVVQTPEATTPTKEIPKNYGGSPIMRGLKSVLNMFRSSQSPIPPSEDITHERLDHKDKQVNDKEQSKHATLSSTPIASSKVKDNSSKRNSPLKESIVFNDDLERELQWKDDTIVILKDEKTPKLSQQKEHIYYNKTSMQTDEVDKFNTTVQHVRLTPGMEDIADTKVVTSEVTGVESDSEFVDCETTYTKTEPYVLETQEYCKTLPIMIETFNIQHGICHEDYVVPLNNVDNIHSAMSVENLHKGPVVTEETISALNSAVISSANLSDKKNFPDSLDISSLPLVENTNESFPLPLKLNDMDNLAVDDKISKVPDSHNVNMTMPEPIHINNLSLENPNVNDNTLTDEINECLIPIKHSCIKEYLENEQMSQILIQTYNLASESYVQDCIKISNDSNEYGNTEIIIPLNVSNTTNEILENKNQLLIQSHTTSYPECEKNDVLENHEKNKRAESIKSPVISDLSELECNDKHISNQTVVLDERECVNKSLTNSVDISNYRTKEIISDFTKDDDVSILTSIHGNQYNNIESAKLDIAASIVTHDICYTNDYNIQDTTNIKCNTDVVVVMNDLKDFNIVKGNKLNNDFHSDNSLHKQCSDAKDTDCEMKCNLYTIDKVSDCRLDDDILQLKQYADSDNPNTCAINTTVSMLETDLQFCKNEISCEINERETCNEPQYEMNDFGNIPISIPIPDQFLPKELESQLPADVPLPNDVDIDNDSSSGPCSVKKYSKPVYNTEEKTKSDCVVSDNNNISPIESNVSIICHENNEQIFKRQIDDISIKVAGFGYDMKDASNQDNLNDGKPPVVIQNEDQCVNNIVEAINVDENLTYINKSSFVLLAEIDSNLPSKVEEDLIDSTREAAASHSISRKYSEEGGYNINFDEITDPFATKTNIRLSPPPEIFITDPIILENNSQVIAKIQNEKKFKLDSRKSGLGKKPVNKSVSVLKITDKSNIQQSGDNINILNDTQENKSDLANPTLSFFGNNSTDIAKENKSVNETKNLLEQNIINDLTERKNVFNIPEINDVYNTFVTKSRICPSPSETVQVKNSPIDDNEVLLTDLTYIKSPQAAITSTTLHAGDNIKDEVNDFSQLSNTTFSSKNSNDKEVTVQEIHTEDEDTIEGPFLEAENLNNEIKVTDIKIEEDMMHFKDIPLSSADDLDRDEIFIDAEAFEFLLNQNKSNVVADSGKESLFLKFDPLFAKRTSSDGVLAALNAIQRKQSTPKKLVKTPLIDVAQGVSEIPVLCEEPSLIIPTMAEVIENTEDTASIGLKPMMIVSPAVSSNVTPRTSMSPKLNRRSLSFTSSAMVVIDRLLSLSGNTSLLDQDIATPQSNKNHDANIALTQLRELLSEKEIHVHDLKCESKELKDRLSILESQVKSLETDSCERLKKISNLNEQLSEKTKINKSMAVVVEEYERTIATLIAEMEQERRRKATERMKLISERDEQTAHLASMEGSFNDLHSKYEKSKQIILSMKANEDSYKKRFKVFDDNVLKLQKNYELLKQHATTKLNQANIELDKMNKAHEADVVKLNAMLKRRELDITSLEESLSQKIISNEKLTAICDELLSKVA